MSKNINAVKLGRMAKGKPKNYSQSELERRRQQLLEVTRKRKEKRDLLKTTLGCLGIAIALRYAFELASVFIP